MTKEELTKEWMIQLRHMLKDIEPFLEGKYIPKENSNRNHHLCLIAETLNNEISKVTKLLAETNE